MQIPLVCPDGLEVETWSAVQQHIGRLEKASDDKDFPLVIGTAKDLVETVCKIILDVQGEVVADKKVEMSNLLARAHRSIDRKPGIGFAEQSPFKELAQGARTIVMQLSPLRNRFGTGDGRLLGTEVDPEVAYLALDAALLWSRWAVRCLGQILELHPRTLIRDLRSSFFRRGQVRERLKALNLNGLELSFQRSIGLAIAHRAMGGTFLVQEEGVEDCANQSDLDIWPEAYRESLVEGLFFDREGRVNASSWGVGEAIKIIFPHPGAIEVIDQIAIKLDGTDWALEFANDVSEQQKVVETINEGTRNLVVALREEWQKISRILERHREDESTPRYKV